MLIRLTRRVLKQRTRCGLFRPSLRRHGALKHRELCSSRTTVRPPFPNIFLSPEVLHSVPSRAGSHINFCIVGKSHNSLSVSFIILCIPPTIDISSRPAFRLSPLGIGALPLLNDTDRKSVV